MKYINEYTEMIIRLTNRRVDSSEDDQSTAIARRAVEVLSTEDDQESTQQAE